MSHKIKALANYEMTLAEIRAAERRRIFLDDLDALAARVSKQFDGKLRQYAKIMGYDLENPDYETMKNDEILNGLYGVIGNAELIQDHITDVY